MKLGTTQLNVVVKKELDSYIERNAVAKGISKKQYILDIISAGILEVALRKEVLQWIEDAKKVVRQAGFGGHFAIRPEDYNDFGDEVVVLERI
jgi:hypothetical protein